MKYLFIGLIVVSVVVGVMCLRGYIDATTGIFGVSIGFVLATAIYTLEKKKLFITLF